MNERQFEMAQRREEQERAAALQALQQRQARRFAPLMLDGEPCCPHCHEPLPDHRLQAGICVSCLAGIERREDRT